mgnify:CR=1 FL=1
MSHSEQCQYSDNSSSPPPPAAVSEDDDDDDVERGGDDRDKSATSSQNILLKLKLAAYRQSKVRWYADALWERVRKRGLNGSHSNPVPLILCYQLSPCSVLIIHVCGRQLFFQ